VFRDGKHAIPRWGLKKTRYTTLGIEKKHAIPRWGLKKTRYTTLGIEKNTQYHAGD
jgi:hypothetical protein